MEPEKIKLQESKFCQIIIEKLETVFDSSVQDCGLGVQPSLEQLSYIIKTILINARANVFTHSAQFEILQDRASELAQICATKFLQEKHITSHEGLEPLIKNLIINLMPKYSDQQSPGQCVLKYITQSEKFSGLVEYFTPNQFEGIILNLIIDIYQTKERC